jgi:hypothetical protein
MNVLIAPLPRGRRSADPAMSFLAKRLRTLTWLHPLAESEKALHIERRKVNRTLRVSLLPDFKTWIVRFYIGGAQRVFGLTPDSESACRFADLVRTVLWKYRTRGIGDPPENDLNFSPLRVTVDLRRETHATELLTEMEEHLLSIKAILTPEEQQQKLTERKEAGRCNRTLGGAFEVMSQRWNQQLDSISTQLSALSVLPAKIDQLQKTVDSLKSCCGSAAAGGITGA